MAQPSSTQPEPQTTVAKSDAETPEKPVDQVNGKEETLKPQEPAASQPAPESKPDAGSQPSAATPQVAEQTPAAAPAPTQTDSAKAVEVPSSTAAPAPEKPAESAQPTASAEPVIAKPVESAPVKSPETPAADAAAAPTLPNISASQVAAAMLASSPQAAPAPITEAPPPKAVEGFKPGDPSFLYVEDDPFSREVITRLIKQNMGFPNLTVFSDSSDFIARVKSLPAIPDVFLLDIQISPLNGHQMLKLLRGDDTFKKSKIIALTASVMASEVKQLQDAGFDGLIGKPVMKRVFPELLQRVLDGEAVWYVS
jgi:CheY-like chemotaxis protein